MLTPTLDTSNEFEALGFVFGVLLMSKLFVVALEFGGGCEDGVTHTTHVVFTDLAIDE